MSHLVNLIHREIQRNQVRNAKPAVGLVDSYDPVAHAVKLKFDTELDENGQPRISGWIPIGVQAAGAGASWVIGPSPGDQAHIEYLEGDAENGIVSRFTHNDVDQPPNAASGEAVLRHTKTGNYFKLSADGSFQHYHVATKNYAKVDKNGNLISHIQQPPGTTFVYLGGDPAASPTPVFSPVSTVAGPSPYLMGRMS